MNYSRYRITHADFAALVGRFPFVGIGRDPDNRPQARQRTGFVDPAAVHRLDHALEAEAVLTSLTPSYLAVIRHDEVAIDKRLVDLGFRALVEEWCGAGNALTKQAKAELRQEAEGVVARRSPAKPRFVACLHDGDATLRVFGASRSIREWLEAAGAASAESVLFNWPLVDQVVRRFRGAGVLSAPRRDEQLLIAPRSGAGTIDRLRMSGALLGAVLDDLMIWDDSELSREDVEEKSVMVGEQEWLVTALPYCVLRGEGGRRLTVRDGWPSAETDLTDYLALSGRVELVKLTVDAKGEEQRTSFEVELRADGTLNPTGPSFRPVIGYLGDDAMASMVATTVFCAAIEDVVVTLMHQAAHWEADEMPPAPTFGGFGG